MSLRDEREPKGEAQPEVPRIQVVGAMLEDDQGRYLITQRRPEASLPLLWEFPGGKVEPAESPEAALARELREEMGIEVAIGEHAATTRHEYPSYEIHLHVFHCRLQTDSPPLRDLRVHAHAWVTLEEMARYPFPDADAKTLAKLLDLD